MIPLGVIVLEELTEFETLEEGVELLEEDILNVDLELAVDDIDAELVIDPELDVLPEVL